MESSGGAHMGIDRSTFLIDAAGQIVGAWHKVKVPDTPLKSSKRQKPCKGQQSRRRGGCRNR